MTDISVPTPQREELRRVAELLGGPKILGQTLTSALDAHEMLLQGLPARALGHLVASLKILPAAASFESAVGMSQRTFQRRKISPAKPLNQEQSGRAWKFAEILSRATAIFGAQEEAEKWMDGPALGLDGRRPIDLLATPAGVELVEDLLTRIEYGVYA